MSLDYYNAQEKTWVSPRLVLIYYDRLLKKYGISIFKNGRFKKVIEAKIVAIALLGIHKITRIHFMMQVPKKVDESPDIVTMNLKERKNKPVLMEIQDVEVVEYGIHSKEDLVTFLINKKLSPSKSGHAYDENTVIICHITKKELLVDHAKLHKKIGEINPKAKVYLLGSIPDKKNTYRFIRIWPKLDSLVEIDIVAEGNKYPSPHSTKFSLGTQKTISEGESDSTIPHPSPYEVFEIKMR